jgi:hypothetical protein
MRRPKPAVPDESSQLHDRFVSVNVRMFDGATSRVQLLIATRILEFLVSTSDATRRL